MERLLKHNKVLRDNFDTVFAIKEAIKEREYYDILLYWNELTDNEKRALWVAPRKGGIFTTEERAVLKSDELARIRKAI